SAVDVAVTVAVPATTPVIVAVLPFPVTDTTPELDVDHETAVDAPFVTATVAVSVAVAFGASEAGAPPIVTDVTVGVVPPALQLRVCFHLPATGACMRLPFRVLMAVVLVGIATPAAGAQTRSTWSLQGSALYAGLKGDAYDGLDPGAGFELQVRRKLTPLWS